MVPYIYTQRTKSIPHSIDEFQFHTTKRNASRRRGHAVSLGLMLIGTLVTLMAMTVELNHITVARTEMKRTADAAALAACWELYERKASGEEETFLNQHVRSTASEVANLNLINQQAPTLSYQYNDVMVGRWDPSLPNVLDESDPSIFNAVSVTLRRQAEVNGPIPFHFAGIFGGQGQSLQVTATAAMLRKINGFSLPSLSAETLNILPIALDEQTWDEVLASATNDNYRVVDGVVMNGSDGIYECSLYPQGTGAPGNRGTVDIGSSNNSTNDIARQILHGVNSTDLAELGKPLEIDSSGILELNGDTGISAGIKDELASIIGQRRIIPIYESVSGCGNNATYRITRFEGVTILAVKLTGPPSKKHLTIQPAQVLARGAVIKQSSSVESSTLFAPVMLVR